MATPKLQVGSGIQGMLKEGYQEMSGLELAILKNIEACKNLGKVTRTSLGPNGMNKLIINHLDKVFVTSNAGTILGELEVVHPAAKMIVMAAKSQEQEYGDYTNFVLSFAGELLVQAEKLLELGVHASDIIVGYKKASAEGIRHLQNQVVKTVGNVFDPEELKKAIKSILSAKQYGNEDILSELVSKVSLNILKQNGKKIDLNLDNVRLIKMIGGSINNSAVLKGMVIRRPAEGTITSKSKAKIIVFATSVEATQTETKGTVRITSAEELLKYNKSEESMLEDQIKSIKDCGAEVVISGGSISEMALHFLDKYELLAVKVTSKFELRRICRTVGATPLVRIGACVPEELGYCDKVFTKEIAGGRCVVFEQEEKGEDSKVGSIILRSATVNQLDDLERACVAGINGVKTICADGRLMAGGGACDIGLAIEIHNLGEKEMGLEQYAIKKFAEALEIVPKILAENAGQDPTKVVSSLYAAHRRGEKNMGINIENGGLMDMAEGDIYDTFAPKFQAFKLASDVAITILSIDQLIMSKAAGGPKLPQQ